MKLLIYTALWKRPEVSEICFMQIDYLRSYFKPKGVEIIPFVVLSEEEMKPLCDKYKVGYCEAENFPVGRKHNIGLFESLKIKWDYMMLIGSDDLVSAKYMDIALKEIEKKTVFAGPDVIYFFNSWDNSLKMHKVNGIYSIGAGRIMSRSMIESFVEDDSLTFWEDQKNKGLDTSSFNRVDKKGIGHKMIKLPEKPYIVDVKSDQNIWNYSELEGVTNYQGVKALEGYFDKEIIKAIVQFKPTKMETEKRVRFEHKSTYYQMLIKVNGEQRKIEFKGGLDRGTDRGRTPGVYATADQGEIEALKKHPECGKMFFVADEVVKKSGKDESAPVVASVQYKVSEEEANTIQQASKFIAEKFEISAALVNTSSKISEWIKNNPGKVLFESPNLQGLHT